MRRPTRTAAAASCHSCTAACSRRSASTSRPCSASSRAGVPQADPRRRPRTRASGPAASRWWRTCARPQVPAVHMNTRHIVTTQGLVRRRRRPHADGRRDAPGRPTRFPRGAARPPATRHDAAYYPRFKKWCDEYFFLPAPQRGARRRRHLLRQSGQRRLGRATSPSRAPSASAFLDVYPRLVRRHMNAALDRRRARAPARAPRPLRRVQPAATTAAPSSA